MPGRIPQDPAKGRLTGHRKHRDFKLIKVPPAKQPALPKGMVWPEQTKIWWKMWGDSPLSDDFTANDWSELLDCARLHSTIWAGAPSKMIPAMAELRQRVAKFGATPLDRQRLRITLATADIEEDRAEARAEQKKKTGARARRGPHVVPDPEDQ
jgi:hypothetical protein